MIVICTPAVFCATRPGHVHTRAPGCTETVPSQEVRGLAVVVGGL